jgi:hypothetical protein
MATENWQDQECVGKDAISPVRRGITCHNTDRLRCLAGRRRRFQATASVLVLQRSGGVYHSS